MMKTSISMVLVAGAVVALLPSHAGAQSLPISVPVEEQNVDEDGNVRVREQGVVQVQPLRARFPERVLLTDFDSTRELAPILATTFQVLAEEGENWTLGAHLGQPGSPVVLQWKSVSDDPIRRFTVSFPAPIEMGGLSLSCADPRCRVSVYIHGY